MILAKALRKIYTKYIDRVKKEKPICIEDPNVASKLIFHALVSENPSMIARFGSTELTTMINYLGVKKQDKSLVRYIKTGLPWWWNETLIVQMQQWSGFFPPTIEKVGEFCELMCQDLKHVDVLGSWLSGETFFDERMSSKKVHLRLLEPFWSQTPWTKALAGKKVLVVHPFSDTIASQYTHRKLLFKNQDVLPEFKSLQVIQAVQSLGEGDIRFKDWFEALDFMKNKIDACDYDVCLIGAGAYGFPLAAHVKRSGKKSVHLGGALQLLFGIKGRRWEDPNYGVKEWGIPNGSYTNLINEHWVRPSDQLKPKNAEQVEGACYW